MNSIVVSNKNTLSFIDYPSKNKSALTLTGLTKETKDEYHQTG